MEKWISHYCNDLIDRIRRNTLSENRWNRSRICSPEVSIFLDRSVVKPLRWIAAYGLVGNRRNYFSKAQHCRSRKWQDCPLLKSFRLGSQLVFPPHGGSGLDYRTASQRTARTVQVVHLEIDHCFLRRREVCIVLFEKGEDNLSALRRGRKRERSVGLHQTEMPLVPLDTELLDHPLAKIYRQSQ
jgi:hypothetical protein